MPARMQPVQMVFRHELRLLLRDARWLLLLLTVLTMTLAALALGLQREHQAQHQHAHATQTDHDIWLAQGHKNPHSAAHFGQYAFKPHGLLTVADPGVDAFAGNAVWLEAHKQNLAQFRIARDGTLTARMGTLSFATVLQTVFPLLAIVLGYAAVSAERSSGTLRLTLSMGVLPRDWILGKALAGMAVLATMVLIACAALGLGVTLWTAAYGHGLQSAPLSWSRLGWMALGYLCYLGGFLALALTVSARLKRPRTALMVLLAFWVLNCFVVPRGMSDWVRHILPLPTAQSFMSAMADAKKAQFGHDESHPAYAQFLQDTLVRYGVERKQDLPVNLRGLALRMDDEIGYRIYDEHYGRLQERIHRQDALHAWAGWLMPLLSMQPWSMSMAGTDNRHLHDFVQQAETHRRTLQTMVSQDLIDNAPAQGTEPYQAGPALWTRMPTFRYQPPTMGWALSSQAGNGLRLAAWAMGTMLLCLWAASRIQP